MQDPQFNFAYSLLRCNPSKRIYTQDFPNIKHYTILKYFTDFEKQGIGKRSKSRVPNVFFEFLDKNKLFDYCVKSFFRNEKRKIYCLLNSKLDQIYQFLNDSNIEYYLGRKSGLRSEFSKKSGNEIPVIYVMDSLSIQKLLSSKMLKLVNFKLNEVPELLIAEPRFKKFLRNTAQEINGFKIPGDIYSSFYYLSLKSNEDKELGENIKKNLFSFTEEINL